MSLLQKVLLNTRGKIMTTGKQYTKKDLEQATNGKSDETTRKTIIACGLDPSQKYYSEKEFQKFRKARKMIDSGETYDDVKKEFSEKNIPPFSEQGFIPDTNGNKSIAGSKTENYLTLEVCMAVKRFFPTLKNKAEFFSNVYDQLELRLKREPTDEEIFEVFKTSTSDSNFLSIGSSENNLLSGGEAQHLLSSSTEVETDNPTESNS
jgi:hypothetical protein